MIVPSTIKEISAFSVSA